MKIISWNVNGIRASWNHGLQTFLYESNADIYCFQETKACERIPMLEIEGYYPYWAFCTKRKAYSGTFCLSRIEPVSIEYGMNGFDDEGRVITLEFPDFFLINCYVPNSQHSGERRDFRLEWDKTFNDYVSNLKDRKPVIICGDFNVALSTQDIYSQSKWVEINSQGFTSDEKENMDRLISLGFVDSYRYLHPDEADKYTWWSNRKFKRRENRGWRLDYFFVDHQIIGKILSSEILDDIFGSDHCPIKLEVDIKEMENPMPTPHRECKYTFSDLLYMGQYNFLKKNAKIDMTNIWNTIDWNGVENRLRAMQEMLAKVAYSRNPDQIENAQKKIVFSLEAKVTAVKYVYEHAKTSGIDGIRWTTPHELMKAALSLTSKDYVAMPSRLLVIKSKNGKERRTHIETYYDRAMQKLYALALDPIAESWADRKSFAFRVGRSALDMNQYIKFAFSEENPPEWAFIGDVKQCYESISHDWIRNNIPMQKGVLTQFLKAGYVVSGNLFPMDEGIGIGCSISHIVANMVLDGMQDFIIGKLNEEKGYSEDMDFSEGNLIRYADDVLITSRSKTGAEKISKWIREFLEQRGLKLSVHKSHVVNINDGFEFMSRYYVKKNNHIYVYPTQSAVERFKSEIKTIIEDYSGSQRTLIKKLNRKIDGWVTYHKVEESEDTFRHLDVYIKALLLELCRKKHPSWDMHKILEKYWYQEYDEVYCYALPENKEIRVKFLSDTHTVNHYALKTSMNPYIDFDYFDSRDNEREIQNVTGKYRAIWNRQNGRCYYCGKKILKDQAKELIEVAISRKMIGRYAYVHKRCLCGSIEFIETDEQPETAEDVADLIESLNNTQKMSRSKYYSLYSFFHNSTAEVIKLNFSKIEELLGYRLGKTARERTEYWYRKGIGNISHCWLSNNYQIEKLNLKKQTITFRFFSSEKHAVNVDIPNEIANCRIPAQAKYELENFYKYIIKKYGL